MDETAIYLHIPFCRTRCVYCDFVTYAGKERLLDAYTAALCREAEVRRTAAPVCSVYFGGGTPSRLSPEQVRRITDCLRDAYHIRADAEFTFECNPCDVNAEYAAALRDCGINRVSLGMQSAVPAELRAMGRRHTHEQTAAAVRCLRDAGIDNLTLDLIYGWPGQTRESWQKSLDAARSLEPRHISMYALSVEPGSILQRQVGMGKVTIPDDDLTADLYDQAAEFWERNGFEHYEISNWSAAPAYESRHNRQYWLVGPYIGLGAGAHSYVDNARIRNCSGIEAYISKLEVPQGSCPAAEEIEPQGVRLQMQDVMMLGLRLLREGIPPERFRARFGVEMTEVFGRELSRLTRRSLIRIDETGTVRLDPARVMVANQAFMEFV